MRLSGRSGSSRFSLSPICCQRHRYEASAGVLPGRRFIKQSPLQLITFLAVIWRWLPETALG